jgi:hypothetical protein
LVRGICRLGQTVQCFGLFKMTIGLKTIRHAGLKGIDMSEPVEYQMRMRPTWANPHLWSDWEKCSKSSFDDYTKTPKLHDWEYEVRTLYTTPPAPQRTWICKPCFSTK